MDGRRVVLLSIICGESDADSEPLALLNSIILMPWFSQDWQYASTRCVPPKGYWLTLACSVTGNTGDALPHCGKVPGKENQ